MASSGDGAIFRLVKLDGPYWDVQLPWEAVELTEAPAGGLEVPTLMCAGSDGMGSGATLPVGARR